MTWHPHIGRETPWAAIAPIAHRVHDAIHKLAETAEGADVDADMNAAHSEIAALMSVIGVGHESRSVIDEGLPDSVSGVRISEPQNTPPETIVLAQNVVNLVDGDPPYIWLCAGKGDEQIAQFLGQYVNAKFVTEHVGDFEPWYHLCLVRAADSEATPIVPFECVELDYLRRYEDDDVEFPAYIESVLSGWRCQIHKRGGEVRVFSWRKYKKGWHPCWHENLRDTVRSFARMDTPTDGVWDGVLSHGEFFVTDTLYSDGMSFHRFPLYERKERTHACNFGGNVRIIPSVIAESERDIAEKLCVVKPIGGMIGVGDAPRWYIRRRPEGDVNAKEEHSQTEGHRDGRGKRRDE